MIIPRSPKELLDAGRREIQEYLHEALRSHSVAANRLMEGLIRYIEYRILALTLERKDPLEIAGVEKALSDLRTIKDQIPKPKEN